jgi:hypothetical protein
MTSMGRRNSNAEHSVLRPASRTTFGGVSVSTVTIRPSLPWRPLYARYPTRSCRSANGLYPPKCDVYRYPRCPLNFGSGPPHCANTGHSPTVWRMCQRTQDGQSSASGWAWRVAVYGFEHSAETKPRASWRSNPGKVHIENPFRLEYGAHQTRQPTIYSHCRCSTGPQQTNKPLLIASSHVRRSCSNRAAP